MATHQIIRTYRDTSNIAIQQTETIIADTEKNFDAAIAVGANHEIDITFTRSLLKTLCISCDQAVDIYTNDLSSGSPQDHLSIKATQVYMWTLATDGLGGLGTNLGNVMPFSGNVTKLYVTNASGNPATLKIRSLQAQQVS